MANVINWFEIPAKNFDRACNFYAEVLEGQVQIMDEPKGFKFGFLPGADKESVGGAVVAGEGYEPLIQGALLYLNGGEDLSKPLSKIENAGGKVLLAKTPIAENGFMAQFSDTEGNRVALYSMK